MRVLSLDTTTRRGSVALVENERVVDERPGDLTRSHAERLPAELVALLGPRGLSLEAVDLFAVAAGPGSFTGIRIGIATIQGLAFVTRRPVVGVSALEAVAQLATAGADAGAVVGVWIDAQRGEVFSALFRTTGAALFTPERLIRIEPPAVGDPGVTLARWQIADGAAPVAFAGDGAIRYADVIRSATGGDPPIAGVPLLAGAIARIAEVRAQRGETVGPAGIRPEYIRRPDAEIDREKRASAASQHVGD